MIAPAPHDDLSTLLGDIRACRLCVENPRGKPLTHAPRPVLSLRAHAPILVAGQAPGTRVHASGQSFTDASGERLRGWMGVGYETFYNPDLISIAAMGFCFPGLDAKGGDLPPRRECALTWHDRLFAAREPFSLVLAIGAASQAYHLRRLGLGIYAGLSLTERVTRWREIWEAPASSRLLVLPHPSWRNTGWLKRHPWFETELVPVLREEVARLVSAKAGDAG